MSQQVKVNDRLQLASRAKKTQWCINNSGDTLAPGDLVVLDTTNGTSDILYVTTTASADSADVFGMALNAAADKGNVEVLQEGLTNLLKVDGTTDIARGDKLSTFTTVKIAAKAATGSNGVFATALEAYATNDSAGVIDAYIHVGRANVSSASGNTLDQSYDQGGAGSGRTVNATDGAVVIQNTQADNADVLQLNYSPSGAANGSPLDITVGANAGSTSPAIDITNSGAGNDIEGTSDLWTVSKAGVALFATVNVPDINAGASGDTTLTVDGAGTGGVNVGSNSTGGITLGRATTITTGGLTITAGGLTVTTGGQTSTGDETHTVAATTGSGVLIDGSTVTSGNVLRVEADATNLNGGKIINATIDGTTKFNVAEDGAVAIVGTAAGTDAITITNGDVGLAAGRLDIDLGRMEIDTTADETSYIKRNQTTTSGPVFEIEETHTGADNAALLVDHNATGAVNAIQVTTDGTGYGMSLEPSVAGGGGLTVVTATAATARAIFVDGTTGDGWVGTGSNGMVELTSDGAIVADGSLLRLSSSGQPAAANDGVCLEIVETGTAQATSYALRIASTNNEALHVDTGVALFDEAATFAAGIVCQDNGAIGIGTASAESTLKSDGSNTIWQLVNGVLKIGDDGSTNYANFANATGALTFLGSARRSKKVWFAPDTFVAHTGTPVSTQVGAGSAFGFAFDAAADESITTTFMVPDNWTAASDVTAKIFWAANDTNQTDVIWDIITVPLAEDEAAAGAGNTDSVTDTEVSATANDLNITAAVTIAASTEWAAGDMVILRINRDADNVGDTLAADAIFLGLELTYTADRI